MKMHKNNHIKHQLKTEIYKKGYTISSFASACGVRRETLEGIFRSKNITRGDTIKLIADCLEIPYEKVEVMCNGC